MKRVILMILSLGTLMFAANFERNSAGVVTDFSTNLQWQDDYSDENALLPLTPAKRYEVEKSVDYCEELELDGKQDWRLPNLNELYSIVDLTRGPSSPAASPIFQAFEGFDYNSGASYGSQFQTSTHHVNNTLRHMVVRFKGGAVYPLAGESNDGFVRCVRGGL